MSSLNAILAISLCLSGPSAACDLPRSVIEIQAGGPVWGCHVLTAQGRPAPHIMAASWTGIRRDITRPALPQGYLIPNSTEAAAWRRWLQPLGLGPKVGLGWK